MRILLVEDDIRFGNGVQTWLLLKGFTVDWVKDGHSALHALSVDQYQLMLLDLQLPRLCGMDLLNNLRQQENATPVIILTARDKLTDRLLGLDSGADDYLVKPFEMEELASRVRAVTRRSSGRASSILSHGPVSLNPITGVVTNSGQVVAVSPREFVLLQNLLESIGKPISRSKLEGNLYAWGYEVESNAVVVHIHNLRRKFGLEFIRNKRGFGYFIE